MRNPDNPIAKRLGVGEAKPKALLPPHLLMILTDGISTLEVGVAQRTHDG
jgi:hypothetical protein